MAEFFSSTTGIIVLVLIAIAVLAVLGIFLEKRTRKVFPEHEAPDPETDDSIWAFGRLTPDSVYDTPALIKYREKQALKAEKEKAKQEERRRRYKELKEKQAAKEAKRQGKLPAPKIPQNQVELPKESLGPVVAEVCPSSNTATNAITVALPE